MTLQFNSHRNLPFLCDLCIWNEARGWFMSLIRPPFFKDMIENDGYAYKNHTHIYAQK